jgi:hypothetical protein
MKMNKILFFSGFLFLAWVLLDRNKKSGSGAIVIGDSQSPFIAKNSKTASLLSKTPGEQSLWMPGKNLSWLKKAVENYSGPSAEKIFISIGTNGGFKITDDIPGLIRALKNKYPDASLFVVPGSWGWGNNKNVSDYQVAQYYNIFKRYGVFVIPSKIGMVSDPHQNLPIYKTIGNIIDTL